MDYMDVVRSLLALDPGDSDYISPGRLAREAAIITLDRDDAGMGDLLGRAWRSGAPEHLLGYVLDGYVVAHGLGPAEAGAIMSLAQFVPTAEADAQRDVDVLQAVGAAVLPALEEALVAIQGDEEPCWCPACLARAAGLN